MAEKGDSTVPEPASADQVTDMEQASGQTDPPPSKDPEETVKSKPKPKPSPFLPSDYVNKEGEEIVVSGEPTDYVYVGECKNCKVIIKQFATKFTIDLSSDIQVEMEVSFTDGTLEFIDSEEITVNVNPKYPLPMISADRTNGMNLYYDEPSAFGSVSLMQCSDVFVYFKPPHQDRMELECEMDNNRHVHKYEEEKFVTETIIREIPPPRTRERPPKKDLGKIFENYLRNLLSFALQPPDPEDMEQEVEEEDDGKTQEEKEKEAKELLASLFSSNIKDEEEKKEIFDSEEDFAEKVDRVAEWMKECKHIVMFTGAGISTSSGIPDYRSGMNTVLKTGPGVWELAANQKDRPEGTSVTPIINALPSPTHMAIVQMQKQGLIKFTVSQNIDGLHRRSGLPPSALSELHGNTNLETCEKCKRQYLRDFETREKKGFDHSTSRNCADPACKGGLRDSIINFGEPLPSDELATAMEQSEKADMCIAMGSTLRVSPANQVPLNVHKSGGKVVICNLQKISSYTPDDNTMQVFAKCDDFIEALCKRLDVEIPPFILYRRAKVATSQEGEGAEIKITVTGLDTDEDLPYSFIKTAAAKYGGEALEVSEEPLVLTLPGGKEEPLPPIIVQAWGHYGEPTFQLECPPVGQEQIYRMSYEVLAKRSWEVTKEE